MSNERRNSHRLVSRTPEGDRKAPLDFSKGDAHGAKVLSGKENIGSNVGQANCELLPPPERFQRKTRDVSEARLEASLQHPLPDFKSKSWPKGTGNQYDNALLKLMLS